VAHRLPDRLLGAGIAGGGVDQIHAVVEKEIENAGDLFLLGFEIADRRCAKAQGRNGIAGFAEGVFSAWGSIWARIEQVVANLFRG
jgi:hypothetical protein